MVSERVAGWGGSEHRFLHRSPSREACGSSDMPGASSLPEAPTACVAATRIVTVECQGHHGLVSGRQPFSGGRRAAPASRSLGTECSCQAALRAELAEFLRDRRVRGLSSGTLAYYEEKLSPFVEHLRARGCKSVRDVTPSVLRGYLLELGKCHNPGGVHAAYRAIRAFLRWWERETEPVGWVSPLTKVVAPKLPRHVLEPVPVQDVLRMVASCRSGSFHDCRDKAILLGLLDTGCRASEFLGLNRGDVNMATGLARVRNGKGGKGRYVVLGSGSRKALSEFMPLSKAQGNESALWVTQWGTRLTYSGLREVVRRRAARAAVSVPSLHSFRRAFALNCLRNGMDIYSLQRLMGHADLSILRVYLAQTSEDLLRVHRICGPVDHLLDATHESVEAGERNSGLGGE